MGERFGTSASVSTKACGNAKAEAATTNLQCASVIDIQRLLRILQVVLWINIYASIVDQDIDRIGMRFDDVFESVYAVRTRDVQFWIDNLFVIT